MNKAILIGNLVADPKQRTTRNDTEQSSFRLAVQRRFAREGEVQADFFDIICWGQTANFVNLYLKKGRKVAVEGRIQNRTYDAEDGTKRYVTEIIADSVEALSPRDDGGER